MRILFLCARTPVAGAKGDQTRAMAQIAELSKRHQIVLIAPRPADAAVRAELEALTEPVWLDIPRFRRVAAALVAGLRLEPLQVGFMMPRSAWKTARERSRAADVVIANTSRALRGSFARPLVVDHVDALSLNMRRRAAGPENFAIRMFAALEARLLSRWEASVAAWSSAQVVTATEDARELAPSPAPVVIPQGLAVDAAIASAPAERDIDLIFTGNMRYPPNRSAVEWADREIVPLVRERIPGVSAWVVGRAASTLPLQAMEVASDVPDLAPYLRRAKIALVPLRNGTGSPNKVLEAALHGAALVATPEAVRPFGLAAATGATSGDLASRVVELLEDDQRRDLLARQATARLPELSVERLVARLEEELVRAAGKD